MNSLAGFYFEPDRMSGQPALRPGGTAIPDLENADQDNDGWESKRTATPHRGNVTKNECLEILNDYGHKRHDE